MKFGAEQLYVLGFHDLRRKIVQIILSDKGSVLLLRFNFEVKINKRKWMYKNKKIVNS
jgi:hypothetical protein